MSVTGTSSEGQVEVDDFFGHQRQPSSGTIPGGAVVVKTRNRAKGLLVERGAIHWVAALQSQRHEAPIEPPIAPAMAGIKLRQRLKPARRRGDIEEGAVEARIANALVEIREAQGSSLDHQLVLDAVDNRCAGTYMGPMMHDDVHKFVARSEAEWRAHIAAAIEAAREPWDEGEVVEPDGDDELVEQVPVPARRQRKRSLTSTLRAARKAGADRVTVDGAVIALSPSAVVPTLDANEWDAVLPEGDHEPN
jgi:hypothetical protein